MQTIILLHNLRKQMLINVSDYQSVKFNYVLCFCMYQTLHKKFYNHAMKFKFQGNILSKKQSLETMKMDF